MSIEITAIGQKQAEALVALGKRLALAGTWKVPPCFESAAERYLVRLGMRRFYEALAN